MTGNKKLLKMLQSASLSADEIATITRFRGAFLDSIDLSTSLWEVRSKLRQGGELTGDLADLNAVSTELKYITDNDIKRISRLMTVESDALQQAFDLKPGDRAPDVVKRLANAVSSQNFNKRGMTVLKKLHELKSKGNAAWSAVVRVGAGAASLSLMETVGRLSNRFGILKRLAAKAAPLKRVLGPAGAMIFASLDAKEGYAGSEEFPQLTGPLGAAATAYDRAFLGKQVRAAATAAASPIADNVGALVSSGQLNRQRSEQVIESMQDPTAHVPELRVGQTVGAVKPNESKQAFSPGWETTRIYKWFWGIKD